MFGNGPIAKRQKGRSVGEKVFRAVRSAVRQPYGASGRQWRNLSIERAIVAEERQCTILTSRDLGLTLLHLSQNRIQSV